MKYKDAKNGTKIVEVKYCKDSFLCSREAVEVARGEIIEDDMGKAPFRYKNSIKIEAVGEFSRAQRWVPLSRLMLVDDYEAAREAVESRKVKCREREDKVRKAKQEKHDALIDRLSALGITLKREWDCKQDSCYTKIDTNLFNQLLALAEKGGAE